MRTTRVPLSQVLSGFQLHCTISLGKIVLYKGSAQWNPISSGRLYWSEIMGLLASME